MLRAAVELVVRIVYAAQIPKLLRRYPQAAPPAVHHASGDERCPLLTVQLMRDPVLPLRHALQNPDAS
jgi:hypothetical protein